MFRYQAKPGFLDALASQDVSQEFHGVDFKALAASVPPSVTPSWNGGDGDGSMAIDTSASTPPPQCSGA